MSDIFVTLPPATSGSVIFGGNTNRPSSEVQEVVYFQAADHDPDSKVKTSYLELTQVPHTHSVVLCKPPWTWGADMGANQHGVCVGCTAVWTKLCQEGVGENKLLGGDLVRLALERSTSAKEAVDVITSLLEEHGQGGTSYVDPKFSKWAHDHSFLVADKLEAWVIETAGKFWATKQITSGCYNISNRLTIKTDMTSKSSNLPEAATTSGLWKSGDSPFCFTTAFQEESSGIRIVPEAEKRQNLGNQLLGNLSKSGDFKAESMFTVLRDEGLSIAGDLLTVGSSVSVLSPSGSDVPDCHWFTATPYPKISVFKPFIFCEDIDFGSYTKSPVAGDIGTGNLTPDMDWGHSLYKAHQKAKEKMETGSDAGVTLANTMKELETTCVTETNEFLQNFSSDKKLDIMDLFKDIAETETKFYY